MVTVTSGNLPPTRSLGITSTGADAYWSQGGSVVKGLEESDRAYRVRAFTRDAAKPVAQELEKRGVDMVSVSLVVGNTEQVYKVFEGVDYAFLVTNYWEHQSKEKEVNEGKLLIDAAKAGGASRIIYGGSIVGAHHFESKALVTDYARSQSGVPFVDLQAGFYGTNLLGVIPSLLTKLQDGLNTFPWPVPATLVVPFIDIAEDYGLCARYMFALSEEGFPNGQSVVTHSEIMTLPEMASQLSEVTRKKVIFRRISLEEFGENMRKAGFPVEPMVAKKASINSLSYRLGPTTISHTVLPRRTRTWRKFAEMSDWNEILH
ncbi:NmrA domain-containing protein [Favolaschia claudopus]|uniref:NmrA domain-containing protein n=1 Tax=Favolaschia claudopus TaxID=2862362 RepID=A0AAW0A7P4_9AGAR